MIRVVSTLAAFTFSAYLTASSRNVSWFLVVITIGSNLDIDISCYTISYYQVTNVVIIKNSMIVAASISKDSKVTILGCSLGYTYTDGFEDEFKKIAKKR